MRIFIFLLLVVFGLKADIIDPKQNSISTRFSPPDGFERVSYKEQSYSFYLQNLPLKPYGHKVKYFDGRTKISDVYVSVVDMPILKQDLIQCADAIMKVRAEYLYSSKNFDKIIFSLTNGFKTPFSKFSDGFRVKFDGNKASWIQKGKKGNNREVFDEYLKFIYIYSGTISLAKDSFSVSVNDIKVGDFFIAGGSPGHAVLVVDLAYNPKNGKKMMLLAQSYMPSQEMHVLKSFSKYSPWYEVSDEKLITPEWIFEKGSLRRFKE